MGERMATVRADGADIEARSRWYCESGPPKPTLHRFPPAAVFVNGALSRRRSVALRDLVDS